MTAQVPTLLKDQQLKPGRVGVRLSGGQGGRQAATAKDDARASLEGQTGLFRAFCLVAAVSGCSAGVLTQKHKEKIKKR